MQSNDISPSRTGMLHPGDVLLAVNNQSLESANVQDAAQLLNNAGEIVTLQISKDNVNMSESNCKSVPVGVGGAMMPG